MIESNMRYKILDECKCGPEEFFVLVSSIDFEQNDELKLFLKVLVSLVEEGLLECRREKDNNIQLTLEAIESYVHTRLSAGESLDEYPAICEEYTFVTTDNGIQSLREEDRPINRQQIN